MQWDKGRTTWQLRSNQYWAWWLKPVIPSLGTLRQEDWEFKASLGYIVRTYTKNKQKVNQLLWFKKSLQDTYVVSLKFKLLQRLVSPFLLLPFKDGDLRVGKRFHISGGDWVGKLILGLTSSDISPVLLGHTLLVTCGQLFQKSWGFQGSVPLLTSFTWAQSGPENPDSTSPSSSKTT
jgi:hypothetical protein